MAAAWAPVGAQCLAREAGALLPEHAMNRTVLVLPILLVSSTLACGPSDRVEESTGEARSQAIWEATRPPGAAPCARAGAARTAGRSADARRAERLDSEQGLDVVG